MSGIKHYYLHVDLDAFFASVEQLDNPELKGKPVIVGGKPEDRRSVVSTASYEARKFGVHSAMPVAKAYQLCPQGIFVHGRMKRYSELSYQIMNIFRDFSPDVQQLSIDEAFIDLTGTEGLFGPPEETAMKIKERVKKETGLTVSAGLAPTKYLAKIASDMNKPDGFYKIEHGDEQSFMLSLPLSKVWGIGDKTYEQLKHSGLLTTRDIYEKTIEALVFMYGQNTGTFLYNVVRGIEIINFDRKAKSHSISNETTFPYDVSDIYTAETCILELCHSVIFRLLKENGFSRTVQVKIRYEDFTTVSIQQTFSQSILTLDSLYNAAKELFEQKYERGRGIRLIGIALENIENTEKPHQQSLFDDGSEKKQKVEKAILTLEKKHPDIKIHKARMLEKLKTVITAILIGTALCVCPAQLNAQDQESTMEISGYWQGTMDGSLNTTFGMGNPFGFSASLPVFKQEVDLSAFIRITPAFYFSLEFLDEFKHNTYTFGYKGQSWLNEFKLSNRGISFPLEYSANAFGYAPGGGENEAPGLMFHFSDFKNKKWSGDIVLRYDMTQTKSVVFYGKNIVNETKIEPSAYLHSESFVIPSSVITQIKDIYIQSPAGTITDSNGNKYVRLARSNYNVYANQKLLVLYDGVRSLIQKNTVPYIVITFFDSDSCATLLTDTGSYSQPESFAGQIQTLFSGNGTNNIDLSDYSELTQAAMTTQIEGEKAFIIQSPQFFSPYACLNSYAVTGGSQTEYLIADRNSGTRIKQYDVNKSTPYSAFTDSDFFEKRTERVYVSKSSGSQTNPLSAQYRFPFADEYPELYLQKPLSIPLQVVCQNLTPVKEYDIGKYADAGSVRVYRNGVLESDARYDSDTGFITLAYPASEYDKIYITYSQDSSSLSDGIFTTGAGFIYNFTPELCFDISFTGKYPYIAQNTYALAETPKNSFSSLTAGINYKNEFIQAGDSFLAVFENENLSGILTVSDFSQTTRKLSDEENTGDENKDETEDNSEDDEDETDDEEITIVIPAANVHGSQNIVVQGLPVSANKGLDIFWTDYTTDGGTITAQSFFTQADFWSYKTINLDFALTQKADMEFILAGSQGEKAVRVQIKSQALEPYISNTVEFNTLTIDIQNTTPQLLINQTAVNNEYYTIEVNKGIAPSSQQIIIKTIKESATQTSGHFYITSLYYKGIETSVFAKNRVTFKLGSEKGKGFIQAASEQGIGREYLNANINGSYTLADINFSAHADASNYLKAAGHSVQTQKPLFNFLSFGQTYRFNSSDGTSLPGLQKNDFIKFTAGTSPYGAELGAQVNAKTSELTQSQNYSINFENHFNTDKTKIQLTANLYSEQNDKNTINGNYFEAWYKLWGLQFTDTNTAAKANNKFDSTLSTSFGVANLSPKLSYEIKSSRNNQETAQPRTSEDSIKLNIPFSLSSNAFSFNLLHKAGIKFKERNASNDLQFLFENQNYYSSFYTSIPIYSLFSPNLMTQLQPDILSSNGSVQYEFLWRRKLFNDTKDMFIPIAAGAAVARDTVLTDTSKSDLYQIKGSLSSKFVNLLPWNFQEEYSGDLNITYRFAAEKPESPVFLISTTEKLILYLEESGIVTVTSDFSIDSSINWKYKLYTGWERNTAKSLLQSLSTAIYPALLENQLNTKVTDSITITLATQDNLHRQSWSYMRISQMNFMTNYSVSAGAGLKFGYEQGKTLSLNLNYNLGIKINF